MKVNEAISELNKIFPDSIQEAYDNTGSQVVFGDEVIKGVYVSLDVDQEIVRDASEKGCNLIVCHHPLIFKPVKKIFKGESKSDVIISLIKKDISVYSIHTNFDKMMYQALADRLGYFDSEPLINTGEFGGEVFALGSFKILSEYKKLSEIIADTKRILNLDFILYSGDESMYIKSIAFINGAGGSLIEKLISYKNPDCIITGDINYHNAKYAEDSGIAVIDAGHFGTEVIFKKMLADSVKKAIDDDNIDVVISEIEKNPLKVY